MANTKKTTSTEKATSIVNTDIQSLEKQVKEQQEQIKQLMTMLQNNVTVPKTENKSTDIGADEEILVISLTPNKLNLVGENGSVLFTFDNMYEEQYIDYASLKEIVRINRNMAKSGRFYILDERVVNKLRLKNNYKNILSPDQLKKILLTDTNKAVELYKLANSVQKNTIIELIKQAKFNGDNIDYNLLRELGELSHVDLISIEDATQIDVDNQ